MKMINSTKIKESVEVTKFLDMIESYGMEGIVCTPYTLWRLGSREKGTFTCNRLKEYLLCNTPFFVGIQFNERYAVFYEYEEQRVIRMVLKPKVDNIEIVTFYIIDKDKVPVVRT